MPHPALAVADVLCGVRAPHESGTTAPGRSAAQGQGTSCDQQPGLARNGSSTSFQFNFNFSRENPGKLENCYELERTPLGEGTFGSARAARCRHTGSLRAVKSIKMKAVKDPRRLQVEISIARKLDHPNVVRLFEIFSSSEHIHLVMELCTGGELFDRIVSEGLNGFNEGTAAKYVQQMLAAVCYLHAHNVAHRDIKPENFLFQSKARDAKLKTIDFGLAKEFEPGQAMTTKVGTPYYVAPQVLQGSYDQKCDVWSVGVIGYLLLCGYAPFPGDNDNAILRRVKRGSYRFDGPAWESVSAGAMQAIKRMLTFEPEARASAAEALEIPWVMGHSAGTRPRSANVSGVVERLQEFREHSRMKRVALTAVAQQLPDSESARLGDIFRAMDRNGDGELSVDEVRRGLAAHGIQPPQALQEILQGVDCNGSGRIDFTEFVAAMMDQELYTKRDLCWAAFCTFDLDGNGLISADELCQVLSGSDVGQAQKETSRDRIVKMVKEVDRNGDGNIDFDEFCKMMSPKGEVPRGLRLPRRPSASVQEASWASMRLARGSNQPGSDTRAATTSSQRCEAAEPALTAKQGGKSRGWRAAGMRVRATMALMSAVKGPKRRSSQEERTASAGAGLKWPWSSKA